MHNVVLLWGRCVVNLLVQCVKKYSFYTQYIHWCIGRCRISSVYTGVFRGFSRVFSPTIYGVFYQFLPGFYPLSSTIKYNKGYLKELIINWRGGFQEVL